MLENITIGQYFPVNSIVHRLDPRVKIVLIIVSVTLLFSIWNYFSLSIMLVFVLLVLLLSKIPIKSYFIGFKSVFPIIIFTGLINIFYGDGDPILELGFMKITQDGINKGVFVSLRLLALILIS